MQFFFRVGNWNMKKKSKKIWLKFLFVFEFSGGNWKNKTSSNWKFFTKKLHFFPKFFTKKILRFHINFSNFKDYVHWFVHCFNNVRSLIKIYIRVLNFSEKIAIRHLLPKNFEIIFTPFEVLFEVSKSIYGP